MDRRLPDRRETRRRLRNKGVSLSQGRRGGDADKETLAIAKLLIDAKANVNFVNGFSQTALYQCVAQPC